MAFSLVASMFMFSLAMSISPGPVNLVIVSSGVNYGFRRTIPFVSGATIGFTLLLAFVGFWLLQLVSDFPQFLMAVAVVGSVFIIYVGYKIASADPSIAVHKQATPTFMQGFWLQWLNPKAWLACASGAALFSNPATISPLVVFVVVYFLVCYASLAAWAFLGDRASRYLGTSKRVRLLNLSMGTLLIASALYLIYMQVLRPGV